MNKHYPKIDNQEEVLKEICKQRLKELYANVSKELEERLDYELNIINKTDTTAIFILLNRAFTNLNIKSYQFGPRGLIGGSLVAYLCGFSNIDPVKYGLSQYVALGTENNFKEPDININLNIETGMRDKIINELERYDEIYKLIPARKKDMTGELQKQLGELFIVSKIENIKEQDYALLIKQLETTDSHDITEFYKLDLLGLDRIKLLEELINTENVNLSDKDIEKDILNYLATENYKEIFDNIPELQSEFAIEIANATRPKTFNDLVKVISLLHGAGGWNNNAEILIKEKRVNLQEVISNRDDIFDILISHGVNIDESYEIMENIRKGKGYIYKKQYEKLSKEYKLPEWFSDSCLKIKYLFSRALAISYALIAWKLLWFKLHKTKEFNIVIEKYKEEA